MFMADSDLLARAKALQAQKMSSGSSDLLARAKALQAQKLQGQTQTPEQDTSALGAAALGAVQGATFGNAPKIASALANYPEPGMPMQDQIDPKTVENQITQYENQAIKQHPVAYMGGNLAGGFAVPIPGAAESAEARGVTRLAMGAGAGAVQGALQNPGQTADAGDELLARSKNALQGGVTGAVLEGGSQALQGMGSKLKSQGLIKLIGGTASQRDKILENKQLPKIEKWLNDHGLTKMGTTTEKVAKKAESATQETGQTIDNIYNSVTNDINKMAPEAKQAIEDSKLSAREIGTEFLNEQEQKLGAGHAEGKQTLGKLRSEVKDNLIALEPKKTVEKTIGVIKTDALGAPIHTTEKVVENLPTETSLEKIRKYRESLDDKIGEAWTKKEPGPFYDALKDLRTKLKNKMDNRIEKLDQMVGDQRTSQLKVLNDKYSTGLQVKNIARKQVARDMGKALGGSGLISGVAGMGTTAYELARGEDPLKAIGKGLATTAGIHYARKYGAGASYQTGKALQNLKNLSPQRLQQMVNSPWMNMNKSP